MAKRMTTAERAKRDNDKAADARALETLRRYVSEFVKNHGDYPRVGVSMMATLWGWPVRNADGGGDIAMFSSRETADAALASCWREQRDLRAQTGAW